MNEGQHEQGRNLLTTTRAVVAAVVAAALLAACSGGGKGAGLPASEVGPRYQSAIGPANSAITSFVSEALAVSAGNPGNLGPSSRRTADAVHKASSELGGIAAAQPLQKDISDVIAALNTLANDLTALATAQGADIAPLVSHVVAAAGDEAAKDAVVRLAIVAATTHSTLPPATQPPNFVTPSTTTLPAATSTTVHHTTTTTSRARATTTTVKR